MIFVVGSGRCGSCWLGRILDSHPEIRCTIEEPPQFQIAASLALWPSYMPSMWSQLLEAYERELKVQPDLHYADKSHPLLWQWERLVRHYPGCWFLVLRRGAERTVASMMKHGSIRERFQSTWTSAEVPCQTLGIGPGKQGEYGRMCLEERAALRWVAHDVEAQRLLNSYPNSVEVCYERLVKNGSEVLGCVQERLGLAQPFPDHRPHSRSLGPVLRPFQREKMQRAVDRFEPWWF